MRSLRAEFFIALRLMSRFRPLVWCCALSILIAVVYAESEGRASLDALSLIGGTTTTVGLIAVFARGPVLETAVLANAGAMRVFAGRSLATILVALVAIVPLVTAASIHGQSRVVLAALPVLVLLLIGWCGLYASLAIQVGSSASAAVVLAVVFFGSLSPGQVTALLAVGDSFLSGPTRLAWSSLPASWRVEPGDVLGLIAATALWGFGGLLSTRRYVGGRLL